jgi:hypothetical protein
VALPDPDTDAIKLTTIEFLTLILISLLTKIEERRNEKLNFLCRKSQDQDQVEYHQ